VKTRLFGSHHAEFNELPTLPGAKGTKVVTKWDEWERIHAEQDARDRKLGIAVLLIIILTAIVLGFSGVPGITS
jgi:hypothetical protein